MGRLLLHSIYNRCSERAILPEYSNRRCTLDFVEEPNGLKYMLVVFEDGTKLKHFENVVDIAEDDGGVWVTTRKKHWRFDNVYDGLKSEEPVNLDGELKCSSGCNVEEVSKVSVCTRCGKRAKHTSSDVVAVSINGVDIEGKFMVCVCDLCNTRSIVEVY